MIRRRYPHLAAGRLVALPFAAAGFAGGWVAGAVIPRFPSAPFGAAALAVIGGLTAYLMYASEGPPRPASVRQASAADGVVTGILTGALGMILLLLVAGTAGGTGGNGLGPLEVIGTFAAGIVVGAATGGGLGLALATGSLRTVLDRPSPKARASKRRRSKQRNKRR